MTVVGFVGLGSMGSALAANVIASGLPLVTYDSAGPLSTPEGATSAANVAEVAQEADVVVLSLPDGSASKDVAQQVAVAADRRAICVIDTSTIGVRAAKDIDELLSQSGVTYIDAPVSGGVAGARARTLAVMYAGSDEACAAVEQVIASFSNRRHRVGDCPGLAQALKLANNFLSATSLAATSEAVAFGLSAGLDLITMLDVLNESSGRNSATSDKCVRNLRGGAI